MKIKKDDIILIKKIIVLLRPYIKKITIVFLCMIGTAGIGLFLPLVSKLMIDEGLIQKSLINVIKFISITFVLVMIAQIIKLIETKYQSYINAIFPFVLKKKALTHTFDIHINYFNNKNASEIMKNLDMDIENMRRITDGEIFFIITGILNIIGGLIGLIVFIDWRLTLVVLFIIPIKIILVKYMAKKRVKYFSDNMNNYEKYSKWYGDTIRGIKEIKLWGLQIKKISVFIKNMRSIIKADIKTAYINQLFETGETILFEIVNGIIYILGVILIINNHLTLGGLFAFVTYSTYIINPISSIIDIGYDFSDIIPSARRFFTFMNIETEQQHTIPCRKKFNYDNVAGNIRLNNVGFHYNEHEKVLENITLDIKSGEKIAIIGANGSGKSTLVELLLMLYQPTYGEIYLDGTNIKKLDLKKYRKMISIVNQDLFLFNASIRDNITLFSKHNDDRLYDVAKKSLIYDFVSQFGNKFETLTGVDGANLSGGQRQKIAFARALMKDSKIFILDEATSNFDVTSEKYINSFIANQLKDKTVIIITHKKEILKNVDKIVLLANNKIDDIGSHDDLLTRNHNYNELLQYNN